MKKLMITMCSLFVSTGLIAESLPQAKAAELSWVDEQVEAIKPARIGAKDYYLSSVHDPFVFLKKTDTKDKKAKSNFSPYKAPSPVTTAKKQDDDTIKIGKFTLEAIINKSALIGGIWYKEGQDVHGYKLEKVTPKMVLLKKSTKTMVLSTKSEHRSLKFNNN